MTLRVDQREIQISWAGTPLNNWNFKQYNGVLHWTNKLVCYYSDRVDVILGFDDQVYRSDPAGAGDDEKVCDVKTLPKVATTSISSWGAFITLLARRRFFQERKPNSSHSFFCTWRQWDEHIFILQNLFTLTNIATGETSLLWLF